MKCSERHQTERAGYASSFASSYPSSTYTSSSSFTSSYPSSTYTSSPYTSSPYTGRSYSDMKAGQSEANSSPFKSKRHDNTQPAFSPARPPSFNKQCRCTIELTSRLLCTTGRVQHRLREGDQAVVLPAGAAVPPGQEPRSGRAGGRLGEG